MSDANVIIGQVRELPENCNDRIDLLKKIVKSGLEKLLIHARENNILLPPYGRGTQPTPLITEEEFIKSGAWKEEKISDTPEYHYEYGFNPIRFLADYIRWAHPNSANERYLNKVKCFERLKFIGDHSKTRMNVMEELIDRSKQLLTLILWGPYISPISSTEIVLLCQPLRQGTINIDISTTESFDEVIINKRYDHNPFYKEYKSTTHNKLSSSDYPYVFKPFKTTINSLPQNKLLYIRLSLEPTPKEETIIENSEEQSIDQDNSIEFINRYRYARFCTLPSESIDDIDITTESIVFHPVTIFALGFDPKLSIDTKTRRNEAFPITSNTSNNSTTLTCLLGDPYVACKDKVATSQYLYKNLDLYNNNLSIVNNSSLIYAWNDSRLGSSSDLRVEEIAYKKYMHELKKFNKKTLKNKKSNILLKKKSVENTAIAPMFIRPPPSLSFQAFNEEFPVVSSDGSTIHNYRELKVGLDIELFVLDSRDNFLGKEQCRWLREKLQSSTAIWKIILQASPFGVKVINELERNPSLMMIKVNEDHDDIDNEGRNKGNLQYVIAKLQSLYYGKAAGNDSDGGSSTGGNSPKSPNKGDKQKDKLLDSFKKVESLRSITLDKSISDEDITIDSGIIILTSGLRNSYIATYDPHSIGHNFACEIMVGSSIITPQTISNDNIEIISNMEPQFLYESNISYNDIPTYSSIKLQENGTLLVQIFSKIDNNDVELHRIVLSVPRND